MSDNLPPLDEVAIMALVDSLFAAGVAIGRASPNHRQTCVDGAKARRATLESAIRAYGAACAAAERERWEAAMRGAWMLIDPLHPSGVPGSYTRGYDCGVSSALSTLRGNLDAEGGKAGA